MEANRGAAGGMSGAPARRRPAVGRQVKRLRADRALTLAQVAERTGMNVGYLSQIENDKASPSLESLSAIADALDVPISWFLIESVPPPRVVTAADRRRWDGPGAVRIEEVDGGISRDICIVQTFSRPGDRTGAHAHPGDEHHVVLSGRFRLTQGEHVVEVGPGDYILWDGSVPHDAELIGEEPGSMLIVTMRGSTSELTRPPQPREPARSG
jgi:transcriptional regulator with XRE-family HTH domain